MVSVSRDLRSAISTVCAVLSTADVRHLKDKAEKIALTAARKVPRVQKALRDLRQANRAVKRATAELSRAGLAVRYSGLVVDCGEKLKSIGVVMPKIPEAVRASEVVTAVLGAPNDAAARKILKRYGIVWTNPIS